MHKDVLPGGLADNKDPQRLDKKNVDKGAKVEREHTTSKVVQKEIARDHLSEDPMYYQKLEKIEKKAFWTGFQKQAGFRVQSMEELGKLKKLLKPDPKQTAFLQAQKDRVSKYLERKNMPGHSASTTANTAAGKGLK